ncbi:MAG: AbrB/MazE/SpoVT family DNA-binding domain-containing protein [Chloroflexi bacterium]|nr:AbrB/MazE/SpoVT family DNA-binding domain-containing protein [Chloroflexota bacterium]MBL7163137.1 AbrB/MazE/SpoVT family DNA-binding domain-containing protein [Anaerolineales bacterium]
MVTKTVQIRQKGLITIPSNLRRKYNLTEGDVYTFVDLGDGTFLLSPDASKVNQYADQVAQLVQEADVDLDELLTTLDEERESYYQNHYAQGSD